LAVAVEDAGFELRDSIAWIYGSGFPKSLNVSKAIDKAAGVQGELIGERTFGKTSTGQNNGWNTNNVAATGKQDVFAPATPEAQKWQGWGTALKPAHEPVVVGRKPLTGTVAANVLEWGVGGLNIDGTRIGTETRINQKSGSLGNGLTMSGGKARDDYPDITVFGRWPSNVMLDEFTAALVDEQSGVSKSIASAGRNGNNAQGITGMVAPRLRDDVRGHNDSGGASRFFYVAKASKRDRNEGLEQLETRKNADWPQSLDGGDSRGAAPRQNFHPTVKPTDLMRQLVKLVTPPGGLVLDPFTGSGSTGKAAILEGMQFVGVELTEEYLPIIEGRLNHAVKLKAVQDLKDEEALF
jgi:site-specific DNA-methyltransferase (adenine-specific)